MIVPGTPEGYIIPDGRPLPRYGKWRRKFIWFARINDKRVFMRYVWRRRDIFGHLWLKSSDRYDYALNDFELLTKGGEY